MISSRPICANGPAWAIVAQMAKIVRMTATVAVSRGPRRNAAQINGKIARNPSGLVYWERGNSGLNVMRPTRIAQPNTAAMSRNSRPSIARQSVTAHRTMTGVTTSAPAVSPSHHVIQTGARVGSAANPAK